LVIGHNSFSISESTDRLNSKPQTGSEQVEPGIGAVGRETGGSIEEIGRSIHMTLEKLTRNGQIKVSILGILRLDEPKRTLRVTPKSHPREPARN